MMNAHDALSTITLLFACLYIVTKGDNMSLCQH
jgi:hypothetical protein